MIITSATRQAAIDAAGEAENAFIAWNNLLGQATLGGTATLTGGDAFNAANGTTADFWLPNVTTTTATLEADFGSGRSVGYGGIAAHNLADFGASAQIQSSDDGVSWTQRGALTLVENNGPMFWRFSGVVAQYWRLRITGLTASDPVAVGVFFIGGAIVIPSRVYQGVSPVITANQVELASNVSVSGNLMGSSTVSRGAKMSLSFTYVAPDFIRGNFSNAINHFNGGGGSFIAWRPGKYPEDIYYGWRDGAVIQPVNSGPKDYMSFDMAMRIHYDR